jgi:dTDP-4-amino-4,6-dideoxygalactose transaminase
MMFHSQPIKFNSLREEYLYFKEDIDKAVMSVLISGKYLLGEQLERFEIAFAKVIGRKYFVGVKNATDALIMCFKAVAEQIGSDIPVILPNFGAIPTAVAAKNVFSNIYYVDVDDTLTIDPSKLPEVKNGLIVPVHLFGNDCNFEKIAQYAKNNHHVIVEDCAQSTGSRSGNFGLFSVFSFYPTKPLSAMADGGGIGMNGNIDRDWFRAMRFYGQVSSNLEMVGVNSRMDEIQSAILNVKLSKFQKLNEMRRYVADRYLKIVKSVKWSKRAVFHQFVVLFNEREKVIEELQKQKIPFMVHYPFHVSEFEPLKGKYNEVGFRVSDKCISLPCHPYMKEYEIEQVENFLWKVKQYEYVADYK